MKASLSAFLALAVTTSLTGCHRDMYEQPKILPEQQNEYFPSQAVDLAPPAHSVPRGGVADDSPFYTGHDGAALTDRIPIPVTPALMSQGRDLFEINCSMCHGRDGYGQGIVVQRGFPAPPSYHTDRLRKAPVGHFFEVITNGYGVMYPFGSRLSPEERWAVIAYIRALQFSQDAPLSELNPEDQKKVEASP
ncbi:MAG TPA: cytochrome c [Candidatus Methylacidiphilales bacterium]|nr:cytochrome c [Candidatus Methylacidiphilales bacterium]